MADAPDVALEKEKYEEFLLQVPHLVEKALENEMRTKKASLLLPMIHEKSAREIAEDLGLNPSTVARHSQQMVEVLQEKGLPETFFVGLREEAANENAECAANDNVEAVGVVKGS